MLPEDQVPFLSPSLSRCYHSLHRAGKTATKMPGVNFTEDRTFALYHILGAASASPRKGTRSLRFLEHLSKLCDVRVFQLLMLALSFCEPSKDTASVKKASFPLKVAWFATHLLLGLKSRGTQEHLEGEKITVLLVYSLDEQGNLSIIGSAHVLATPSFYEHSARKPSFWESRAHVQPQLLWHAVNLVLCLHLDLSERRFLFNCWRTLPLLHYLSGRQTRTIFGFLKYASPRRLNSSRKVLLDEDGYQITHIGQGAFAVISRVLYRPTGDVRVMKRITFDDSGLAKYLTKNEVDTLRAMSGNIWFPHLLNEFIEGGQFVVTMPFYWRGDLAGYIEHKRHLGREAARFYSAQLILAIQSLHKVGIIHRDIKPDNIFLDEDGHLVLADFGLAENIALYEGGEAAMANFPLWLEARAQGGDNFPFLWFDEHNPLSMRGIAGTFWYTAPEVFRKERYSFGVDYWSVGVIYHELITGHIPFNHFKPYPENKYPDLDFRTKPGQLKDIAAWEEQALSELLAPYPTGRPKTLTDIKNSHIFQGVDWIRMSKKGIPPPSLPPPLVED